MLLILILKTFVHKVLCGWPAWKYIMSNFGFNEENVVLWSIRALLCPGFRQDSYCSQETKPCKKNVMTCRLQYNGKMKWYRFWIQSIRSMQCRTNFSINIPHHFWLLPVTNRTQSYNYNYSALKMKQMSKSRKRIEG